jgi:hypothetical protein
MFMVRREVEPEFAEGENELSSMIFDQQELV